MGALHYRMHIDSTRAAKDQFLRSLSEYRDVRVAVLGAAGFVGCWVSRALCAQHADLNLFVRDEKEARSVFSFHNIMGKVHQIDLEDRVALSQALEQIRPQITFNMSGYGVDPTERDEQMAFRINADLVPTLCASIARIRNSYWQGQDIVQAGTALEYGSIAGNLSEDSNCNPTTLYARSKLAGTLSLSNFCNEYQVKGVVARLFSVYGSGEHPARLLPSLIETAATGRVLQLTHGEQKRDLTYVEDVAEGLLRLGLCRADSRKIVNLATGKLTSIREFALKAASLLEIPTHQLNFGALPPRAEEMKHAPVTIERLWRMTGWVPSVGIAEGIRRTIEFLNKSRMEQN